MYVCAFTSVSHLSMTFPGLSLCPRVHWQKEPKYCRRSTPNIPKYQKTTHKQMDTHILSEWIPARPVPLRLDGLCLSYDFLEPVGADPNAA